MSSTALVFMAWSWGIIILLTALSVGTIMKKSKK